MNDTETLKGLIDSLPGRTHAAKLRALMPVIDKRVRDGVQHVEILEALSANGLTMSLNTFRSNLYRYRTKLRNAQPSPAPVQPAPPTQGNLPAAPSVLGDELPDGNAASDRLTDLIDAQKRGDLGDKYLNQSRPILGRKKRPE